ncbi:MAG: hypothetical protein Kow00106_15440 [Anaerolineae bacterium]
MNTPLPACPRCNARLLPQPDGPGLWCQFCGYRSDTPQSQALAAELQARPESGDYQPPYRDWRIEPVALDRLNEAWRAIQRGDRTSAAYMLREMLSTYPSLADIWYLLSLTTDDRGEKLQYLQGALALQPYHEYAWRDKGILEGAIPSGEAPSLPDPAPAVPVSAESETPACPLCGGRLAYDAATDALVCAHCGHRDGASPRLIAAGRRGYRSLEHAQLQRRFGFSQEWHIGRRVLICQNCHAQITLSGETLTGRCPFCDSAHILLTDAVGSFEAPDALIPFRVDRRAAARAVQDGAWPVERGTLTAIYLPFWAFESVVLVRMPVVPGRPVTVQPGVYAVHDALVAGTPYPPDSVLDALMPYHLDALVPYDPRYLAHWQARLYSVDVMQASLAARAHARHQARLAATGQVALPANGDYVRRDAGAYALPETWAWLARQITIHEMHYRLLLLPVWFVTLEQRGGGAVPAYVNGQTGEAVLSDSFAHPEQLIGRRSRSAGAPAGTITPLPRRSVIRPLRPEREPR